MKRLARVGVGVAFFLFCHVLGAADDLFREKIPRPPNLILTDAKISEKKVILIIDTGASHIALDSSYQNFAKAISSSTVEAAMGNGVTISMQGYEGFPIQIQSLVLEKPLVVFSSFRVFSKLTGIPIAGLLGMEAFHGYKLLFDNDAGIVSLHSGDWKLAGEISREVSLSQEALVPSMRVKYGGHDVEMKIDTGYDGCINLPSSTFDTLVDDGMIELAKVPGRSESLGGSSFQKRGWFLKGELMGKSLKGKRVGSKAERGEIGLAWLSGFNFEVDFDARKFRYQIRSNANAPIAVDMMIGMILSYSQAGARIERLRPDGKGAAELYGLRSGDVIKRFGMLTTEKMNRLTVAEMVVANAERNVEVEVYRESEDKSITVNMKIPAVMFDQNFLERDIMNVSKKD